MKRTTKNVFLFAAMFVAVGMLTLTLSHGYGVIGGAGNGAHLAFATVWVFLFAFRLPWAILSRCNAEKSEKRGGDGQWKSEPASNGTN